MILKGLGHLNTSDWTSFTRHFSHIFSYTHWRDPLNNKSCMILSITLLFFSHLLTSAPSLCLTREMGSVLLHLGASFLQVTPLMFYSQWWRTCPITLHYSIYIFSKYLIIHQFPPLVKINLVKHHRQLPLSLLGLPGCVSSLWPCPCPDVDTSLDHRPHTWRRDATLGLDLVSEILNWGLYRCMFL